MNSSDGLTMVCEARLNGSDMKNMSTWEVSTGILDINKTTVTCYHVFLRPRCFFPYKTIDL